MSTHELTVRFLVVRGSIATPGADKTAGGNTACGQVTSRDTRSIIHDGTGLRGLRDEQTRRREYSGCEPPSGPRGEEQVGLGEDDRVRGAGIGPIPVRG